MSSTVSLLEIIWTVGGMLGLIVQVLLIVDAFGDLRFQRNHHPNSIERAIVAWQTIRNEAIRFILQSFIIWIGLVAATLPPRMPSRGGGVVTSVVIPVIYIIVVFMISGSSLFDYIDRRRLLENLNRLLPEWDGKMDRRTGDRA